MQKTKAHCSIDTPNLSQEDIWEIKVYDKADQLAKKPLRSLISSQPAAWSVAVQQTKKCSKEIKNVWDLHQQASARVLEAKKATEDIHPENNTIWNPPNPPEEACQPFFELPAEWPAPCRQWDNHWLRIVQVYFSLLQWPPVDTPGQASFVEVLFDLLITYSTSAPQDMQQHRDTPFEGPRLSTKEYDSHRSYFHLFPPHKSKILPRPLLQDALNLFRRTFNHLQSRQEMTPLPFIQLPSLKPSFCNLTISFPIRPVLLNPSLVAQAVRQHILPNRRNFSVYVSLPRAPRPLQFPDDFRAEFHQ